jgi:hypothetical protein
MHFTPVKEEVCIYGNPCFLALARTLRHILFYTFSPDIVCRFIRGKVSFADQSEREAPPKGSGVVHLLYGSKQLRDALSSIASLYESFVGPLHFHAMSHLLGYQGIAMILEQLLHIVEGQVRMGEREESYYGGERE